MRILTPLLAALLCSQGCKEAIVSVEPAPVQADSRPLMIPAKVELYPDPTTSPPKPVTEPSKSIEKTLKPRLEVGTVYQGMWNHRRINYQLELEIVELDPDLQTVVVAVSSPGLENNPKRLEGFLVQNRMEITGVVGTGIEDQGDGFAFDVRDLLHIRSIQKAKLWLTAEGKLKGQTEDGPNLYFWGSVEPVN